MASREASLVRDLEAPRLGIAASRKVGNAIVRNRVKRSVREWFRAHRDGLPRGTDVVVIARTSAARLSGPEIVDALIDVARRAGARA
jgi:ribonuclease P protein component